MMPPGRELTSANNELPNAFPEERAGVKDHA